MSNKKKGNSTSSAKGKAKEGAAAVDDWDSILEAEIKANQHQTQTQTQTAAPTQAAVPDVSSAIYVQVDLSHVETSFNC